MTPYTSRPSLRADPVRRIYEGIPLASVGKWFEPNQWTFVRQEPISKSCEITRADNLNRRRRLSRKAQCLKNRGR